MSHSSFDHCKNTVFVACVLLLVDIPDYPKIFPIQNQVVAVDIIAAYASPYQLLKYIQFSRCKPLCTRSDLSASILMVKMVFLVPVSCTKPHCSSPISGLILFHTLFMIIHKRIFAMGS